MIPNIFSEAQVNSTAVAFVQDAQKGVYCQGISALASGELGVTDFHLLQELRWVQDAVDGECFRAVVNRAGDAIKSINLGDYRPSSNSFRVYMPPGPSKPVFTVGGVPEIERIVPLEDDGTHTFDLTGGREGHAFNILSLQFEQCNIVLRGVKARQTLPKFARIHWYYLESGLRHQWALMGVNGRYDPRVGAIHPLPELARGLETIADANTCAVSS